MRAPFSKLIVALALVAPTWAQEPKPAATAPIPKVGYLPFTFSEDRPPAIEKVNNALKTLVQGVGMEWVDEGRILGVWTRDLGERPTPKQIPEDKKLLNLGRRLGVDYLVAGTCDWKIRSIWVALGPKTKAVCTVELVVIDVRNERVAHRAKEVARLYKERRGLGNRRFPARQPVGNARQWRAEDAPYGALGSSTHRQGAGGAAQAL